MSINQGCFWIQGTSSLSHENSMCGSFSHPSCHFSAMCKALKFSAWGSGIQRTSQTPQGWLITKEKWRQTGRQRVLTGFFFSSETRFSEKVVVVPFGVNLVFQVSLMDHLLSPPILVSYLHDRLYPTHLEEAPKLFSHSLPVNPHQKLPVLRSESFRLEKISEVIKPFQGTFSSQQAQSFIPAWYQDIYLGISPYLSSTGETSGYSMHI